jgi:hypothetical protein
VHFLPRTCPLRLQDQNAVVDSADLRIHKPKLETAACKIKVIDRSSDVIVPVAIAFQRVPLIRRA